MTASESYTQKFKKVRTPRKTTSGGALAWESSDLTLEGKFFHAAKPGYAEAWGLSRADRHDLGAAYELDDKGQPKSDVYFLHTNGKTAELIGKRVFRARDVKPKHVTFEEGKPPKFDQQVEDKLKNLPRQIAQQIRDYTLQFLDEKDASCARFRVYRLEGGMFAFIIHDKTGEEKEVFVDVDKKKTNELAEKLVIAKKKAVEEAKEKAKAAGKEKAEPVDDKRFQPWRKYKAVSKDYVLQKLGFKTIEAGPTPTGGTTP